MQILLFSLIPVGIILLFISLKLVKKTFSGNIILEIPYSLKSSELIIKERGVYAIWHKIPLREFEKLYIPPGHKSTRSHK